MNYDIILSPSFKNSIRSLKKRFPSVKKDVELAIETILENPKLGVVIPGGSGVRKFRLKNSDLARGKRGGYRMLYYTEFTEPDRLSIFLLLIYAKSDKENTTAQEIQRILDEMRDS